MKYRNMNQRIIRIAILGALQITCAGSPPPATPAPLFTADSRPDDAQIERFIDDLISRMTLAEKVGQMTQVSIKTVTPEAIRRYRFGSVLNGGGAWPGDNREATAADWVAFADMLWNTSMEPSASGVAIPILWGTDAVHGHNNKVGATLFPHNIGLGAANDPDLMEEIGRISAREIRATGVDWTFAPVVAVSRDHRWGRTYESFGSDPKIVAELGSRYVRGVQHALYSTGVIATAKHYLGDGGTANGVDQGNLQCNDEVLRQMHLPGYIAALNAGAQTIMVSLSSVNGEKMHGQQRLIQGLLKDELGFDGIVVSDWNGIAQIPGCTADRCAKAVNAGIDLFMVPFENDWKRFIPGLVEMVESGEVPLSRIDDAVRRILRVKVRAGLFHTPPSKREGAGDENVLGRKEHRDKAREAVRKSLVLLKNDAQLLPLKPTARVLVAGESTHNLPKQAGGWSVSWQGDNTSNSDFPGATSILDGIRASAASVEYDLSGLSADPAKHDVAIVVIGESPYAEFSGDVVGGQTLELAATHPEDFAVLEAIHRKGIPIVTVLITGRPLFVNRELNQSRAFVVAWLPGTEGGGVADVLFAGEDGKARYDFTGRLPLFWPAAPCQASADALGQSNPPLFPARFGLTYASTDSPGAAREEPKWTGYGCTGKQAGNAAGTETLVLLGSGADPHWGPWFGDPSNWEGAPGIPDASIPNIRVTAQDDAKGRQWEARRLQFSGEGYWTLGGDPRDSIAYYIADYALVFDIRVNSPVKHPLSVEITCVYPCLDRVDITETLQQAAIGQWFELRLPLKKFIKTDFSRVSAPFGFSATGPVDISVGNIRWEKQAP